MKKIIATTLLIFSFSLFFNSSVLAASCGDVVLVANQDQCPAQCPAFGLDGWTGGYACCGTSPDGRLCVAPTTDTGNGNEPDEGAGTTPVQCGDTLGRTFSSSCPANCPATNLSNRQEVICCGVSVDGSTCYAPGNVPAQTATCGTYFVDNGADSYPCPAQCPATRQSGVVCCGTLTSSGGQTYCSPPQSNGGNNADNGGSNNNNSGSNGSNGNSSGSENNTPVNLPTDANFSGLSNPVIGTLGKNVSAAENGSIFQRYFISIWKSVISLGGLIVIIMFLWGAIDWILAGGDSGKVQKARDKMTQATVGLIILASSFVIIAFIGQLFFGGEFDILKFNFSSPNSINNAVNNIPTK